MNTAAQAWQLQERGTQLANQRRYTDAHPFFQKAVDCFAADDLSAEAASANYDLGMSYANQVTGPRIENLVRAEEFVRRALASPARRADPMRHTMTLDRLAVTLRDLHELGYDKSNERLEESERCSREAIQLAIRSFPGNGIQIAKYENNLANLYRVTGKFRQAVRLLESAESRIPVASALGPDDERLVSTIRLNLAAHLFQSDRPSDRARASQVANRLLACSSPLERNRAALLLASEMSALTPSPGGMDARALFREVQTHLLDRVEILRYGALAERLGEEERALYCLHEAIDDGIHQWSSTLSDASGDHEAAPVQELAAVAARLYANLGKPIDAFLGLEANSALRFSQAVHTRGYRVKDPIARAVLERSAEQGHVAQLLENLAGLLSRIPSEGHREAIRAGLNQPVDTSELASWEAAATERVLREYRSACERALEAQDVVASLNADAGRAARLMRLYQERATDREPEWAAFIQAASKPMHMGQLAALLRDNPRAVLMRINLLHDLFVAAVWWDGERAAGRTSRVALPDDWFHRLRAMHRSLRDGVESAHDDILALFDLSGAFPDDEGIAEVIVLPSHLASLLPLSVVGPSGKTLVDRFARIVWSPSTAPFRFRQASSVSRSGSALVVPPGTSMGMSVLETSGAAEKKLVEAAATFSALRQAVRTCDAVVFYTHGHHAEGDEPAIDLADEALSASHVDAAWNGMERAEVWACESGVEMSFDPRSPELVDEPFGLDSEMLRAGVRSTIGTLWPVYEIVTVSIMRRYRALVTTGMPADRALTEAQRWWRQDAIPRFRSLLESMPAQEAIDRFETFLGYRIPAGQWVKLGPAPGAGEPMEPAEAERWLRKLGDPCAWGGFRFMGVCDFRPEQVVDREPQPLTDEESREVEALLTPVQEVEEPQRDELERVLDEALAKVADRAPTVSEALAIAEIYRARRCATEAHNLIASLAWLYEGLAACPDSSTSCDELRGLVAVRCVELALTYTVLPPTVPLSRRGKGLLKRARTALSGAKAGAFPYIRLLLSAFERLRGAEAPFWKGRVESLPPEPPKTDTDADALVLLSEVVDAANDHEMAQAIFERLAYARDARRPRTAVEYARWGRLANAGVAINSRAVGHAVGDEVPDDWLNHRAQAFKANREQALAGRIGAPATAAARDKLSESLTLLEKDVFGGLQPDAHDRWRGTGQAEPSYWFAALPQISAATRDGEPSSQLVHTVACMQNLADLRVLQANRWIRGTTAVGLRFGKAMLERQEFVRRSLAFLCRERERVLDLLFEAACGQRLPTDDPDLDPFVLSAEQIEDGFGGLPHVLSYLIAASSSHDQAHQRAHRRTGAGSVVAVVESARHNLEVIWRLMGDGKAKAIEEHGAAALKALHAVDLMRFAAPGFRLDDNETYLQNMPEWYAICTVGFRLDGALFAILVTRGQRKIVCTSPVEGRQVKAGFVEVVYDSVLGEKARPSEMPSRGAAWKALSDKLGSLLAPLIDVAKREGCRSLGVFAPGHLRPLPWTGVNVGGRPLHEHFERIVQLPALDWAFGERMTDEPFDACLFAQGEEDSTPAPFGSCVVAASRAWFPPRLVLGRNGDRSSSVVEADQLQNVQDRVTGLRYYGDGAFPFVIDSDVATGLVLEGGRAYGIANTRGIHLPLCASVELWAPSAVLDPDRLLFSHGDRIPGMARAFLLTGAHGVVDLAWPIHDLVRALVFERYYLERYVGNRDAGTALHNAVVWAANAVAVSCDNARGAVDAGREVLARLDDARAQSARDGGLDTSKIKPFAEDADSLAMSRAPGFLDDIVDPVHYAAFRYWGA